MGFIISLGINFHKVIWYFFPHNICKTTQYEKKSTTNYCVNRTPIMINRPPNNSCLVVVVVVVYVLSPLNRPHLGHAYSLCKSYVKTCLLR